MRALQIKLLRDLFRARVLVLAITSIITVGVTCFVAMQSAYQNLSRAKGSYYRICRMADFWVDLKKAPLSALDEARRVPGVSELEARIQFAATVDLPEVEEPINALVLTLPERRQTVINDVLLRQGSYFTQGRSNEVLVSDKFAAAHRLGPGHWVSLLVKDRRQELFIVGTVKAAEFTYAIGPGAIVPDFERFGVFYVKQRFAEEAFGLRGAANQFVGLFSPQAAGDSEEILRRLEAVLEDYGVLATTPLRLQASNQFLSNEIEGLGAIATVIPTIFLAVAALVLNVLIGRLARRQRTTVGTLKALGYSDVAIFAHFLSYGACVGVLGGILGSVLGYLASSGMTAVYRWFFDFPDLRSGIYWHTHAIGISVSLVCSWGGSFHAAWTMLRLRPAAAMRPAPPARGGTVWLERLLGRTWQRFSASWRMVLRSLLRHRIRSSSSVFAAAMGAGLLVTGFMMAESQDYLLDFQFYRLSRSDVDLSFTGERGMEVMDELLRLPGVDHAEPWLTVTGDMTFGPHRRKISITGLREDARLTIPRDAAGRPIPLPTSGLVLSRRLAGLLQVEVGDEVAMTPVKGERRAVTARVARIADSYMGLSVYAEIGYLSRLVGEHLAVSGAQLQVDGDRENWRALQRELKRRPGIESVTFRDELIRHLTETLLQNQQVFLTLLILFSGVIFFGSIVNSSMVNLAERQGEVATLLALGYSRWQVGGLFFRESMVTNLLGTLCGLPLGYLLTWLTALSYDNDVLRLPLVTRPWIWWTTLLLAVLFGLAAHGVVQRSIHQLNYVDALKVRE